MDLYKQLAAKELGISEDEVTPEQRHEMKQKMFLNTYGEPHSALNGKMNLGINFSDLYGMISKDQWNKLEKEFNKDCKTSHITMEDLRKWAGQLDQE